VSGAAQVTTVVQSTVYVDTPVTIPGRELEITFTRVPADQVEAPQRSLARTLKL